MSRPRIALVVLASLVGAGLVAGVAYTMASPQRSWFELNYDDGARLVEDWCENVQSAFSGEDGGPTSFEAVVALARAGELKAPEKPATTDPATLDRWQAEHADYATSAFLTALGGYPKEIGFQHLAFTLAMGDAHAGRPLADPAYATSSAREMDQYRRAHCGKGST